MSKRKRIDKQFHIVFAKTNINTFPVLHIEAGEANFKYILEKIMMRSEDKEITAVLDQDQHYLLSTLPLGAYLLKGKIDIGKNGHTWKRTTITRIGNLMDFEDIDIKKEDLN